MHALDERLDSALAAAGLDALLVTRDANQRYLEGYTGSECYLLAGRSGRWLIADSRYTEQAGQECRTAKVVQHRDPFPPYGEVVAALAREHGLKAIGFEKATLTYAQYEAISAGLGQGASFVPTEGIVERLRTVKGPEEIARIRKACAIADQALEAALKVVQEGMSEAEFSRELEHCLVQAGADGVAFPTIAAFGAHASQPHAVPGTETRLRRGDFILVDYGALHQGYRSDTTRTFILGKADARQREAYAAVLESQLRGIAATRPGASGREPDAASREYVRGCGFPEFGYGVGHGVGLEIHELPFMSRKCEDTLVPGTVVTVEPGVYLPGWGGIRIEDTVLVTEDGRECLTRFPKDRLIEL
ncbi:MAG TPA: Xaa-Pro peptidase family protein [Holophaga sp.]|nr:Xaa-Pro peptidase family protein [Holophaga sp.]HPS67432.1 Xaa-Pro peptidase family protein [Holophaga sp.]